MNLQGMKWTFMEFQWLSKTDFQDSMLAEVPASEGKIECRRLASRFSVLGMRRLEAS